MLHSPEEAASDETVIDKQYWPFILQPPGPAFKIRKKTLNTFCISDPIICSKNVTITAESYHEGTEPTQTRYARERDKLKKKPNSTRGQHNYTKHAAKAAHRDQYLNAK